MSDKKSLVNEIIRSQEILKKQINDLDDLLVLFRVRNALAENRGMSSPIKEGTIKGHINSRERLIVEVRTLIEWQWSLEKDIRKEETLEEISVPELETVEPVEPAEMVSEPDLNLDEVYNISTPTKRTRRRSKNA